jgi:hypothetical protein
MAEMLLVFSVHFYFCKGRGEVDQAGGQHWAQSDCIDGGSGQGSASGAPVYQPKEKPIVTYLGGTSWSARLGGTSSQGVFILVAHLVRRCASAT